MATREELQLELDYLDLVDAYVAAKAIDRDSPECKEAKRALNEFRRPLRELRDAALLTPAPGDAVAQPATVGLTAAVKEV